MEGHGEGNPDNQVVNKGAFKGFTVKEVHQMGNEAAADLELLKKARKVLAEDENRVGYQTDAGVFVEDKKTGHFTRVGDTATVRGEAKAGK